MAEAVLQLVTNIRYGCLSEAFMSVDVPRMSFQFVIEIVMAVFQILSHSLVSSKSFHLRQHFRSVLEPQKKRKRDDQEKPASANRRRFVFVDGTGMPRLVTLMVVTCPALAGSIFGDSSRTAHFGKKRGAHSIWRYAAAQVSGYLHRLVKVQFLRSGRGFWGRLELQFIWQVL